MQSGCRAHSGTFNCEYSDQKRMKSLSDAMAALHVPSRNQRPDNLTIPAGYTYLAQFIAHDLAFHRLLAQGFQSSVQEPTQLQSGTGHSGRLDLSSLYGGGPIANPSLFVPEGNNKPRWRFALDPVAKSPGKKPRSPAIQHARDLPRRDPNPFEEFGMCTAYTADPRNDMHILISQLTVLFKQFHNKVADSVAAKSSDEFNIFETTRRLVLASFHLIVLKDFLPRLLSRHFSKEVSRVLDMMQSDTNLLGGLGGGAEPTEISKAFTTAAFRVGHMMVRDGYSLSADRTAPSTSSSLYDIIQQLQNDVGQKTQVREDWVVEWDRFFFDVEPGTDPFLTPDGRPRNFSRKLWPTAPAGVFGSGGDFVTDDEQRGGILYRDLMRGVSDGLDDADAWIEKVQIQVPEAEHMRPKRRAHYLKKAFDWDLELNRMTLRERRPLVKKTPLILYIILEAMKHENAERLGYVGSHIVGGTICSSILAASSGLKSATVDWLNLVEEPMPHSMPELLKFLGQTYD